MLHFTRDTEIQVMVWDQPVHDGPVAPGVKAPAQGPDLQGPGSPKTRSHIYPYF